MRRNLETASYSPVQTLRVRHSDPVNRPRWKLVSQEPRPRNLLVLVVRPPYSAPLCPTGLYLHFHSWCYRRLLVDSTNSTCHRVVASHSARCPDQPILLKVGE